MRLHGVLECDEYVVRAPVANAAVVQLKPLIAAALAADAHDDVTAAVSVGSCLGVVAWTTPTVASAW
jgi:hypothetical protein